MDTEFSFFRDKKDKNRLFSFWVYGKVPLTFFIISIIFFIISIVVNYFTIPIPLLGLIFTPILTSLLVILIDIHNSKNKNDFFLELLIDEIGHNLLILFENNQYLESECDLFKNKHYSVRALYPLKFDIWKYSGNNQSINQFKEIMGRYNGFLYEAMRYNENINFRRNINPIIYKNEFFKIREKNNKFLLDLGNYAYDNLEGILNKIGTLSVINTQQINQDEIIKLLKKDGFSPKQIDYHLKYINNRLSENKQLFVFLYLF